MKTLKMAFVALLAMGLSVASVSAQTTKKQKSTTKTTTQKAAPAKHLKKDGTPDMRYKENKKASAAKKSAPAKTGAKSSKAATASPKGKAKPAKKSTSK